jgi:RNA polymerase primary sigma factor
MEHSSVVASYLRHADTQARPTRDDEWELIRRARRGERAAVDRLMRSYLAFVIGVTMEFRGRGVPFEDLIHEGCLGLLKSIDRFDPERGARFMTYAAFWVRKGILDALAEQPRMVRVPRYQREKRGVFPREVRLDAPIDAERTRTLSDELADSRHPPAADAMIEREAIARMRRELATLSSRERIVLASRFGLAGEPALTLLEVGARLDLSRERVRQIEVEALTRLRGLLGKRVRPLRGTESIPKGDRPLSRRPPIPTNPLRSPLP